MLHTSRCSGITGLVVMLRAPSGGLQPVAMPASAAKPYMVRGAGLRRRQNTSLPKGRAGKGRFPGAAGKLRP